MQRAAELNGLNGRGTTGAFGQAVAGAEPEGVGTVAIVPVVLSQSLNLMDVAQKYEEGFAGGTAPADRFALVIGVNIRNLNQRGGRRRADPAESEDRRLPRRLGRQPVPGICTPATPTPPPSARKRGRCSRPPPSAWTQASWTCSAAATPRRPQSHGPGGTQPALLPRTQHLREGARGLRRPGARRHLRQRGGGGPAPHGLAVPEAVRWCGGRLRPAVRLPANPIGAKAIDSAARKDPLKGVDTGVVDTAKASRDILVRALVRAIQALQARNN